MLQQEKKIMKPPQGQSVKDSYSGPLERIEREGLLWKGSSWDLGLRGLFLGSSSYSYKPPNLLGFNGEDNYLDTGWDQLFNKLRNAEAAAAGDKRRDKKNTRDLREWRLEFWKWWAMYNSIVASLGEDWRREDPEDYADPDNEPHLRAVLGYLKPRGVLIIGDTDNARFAKYIVNDSGVKVVETCKHLSREKDEYALEVYKKFVARLKGNQ